MIPIAKPYLGMEEVEAAKKAILSGWVTQGPKVQEFEKLFTDYTKAQHSTAVSNCTTALQLSLLVCGVKPGDIVLTVSHSFIATANAVRHVGAEPVFIDIEKDSYNMSSQDLKSFLENQCFDKNGLTYLKNIEPYKISPISPLYYIDRKFVGKVAAILAVHQMGIPCDIQAIKAIASSYKLPLIEDAACAIGSEYSLDKGKTWHKIGRPVGDLCCFSFHPRKLLTMGEGGMITTNNADMDARLKKLRHHGMSISDLVRHTSEKVLIEQYNETGFNHRLTDIQAAIGIEQMSRLDKIIEGRRYLASLYRRYLKEFSWLEAPLEPSFGHCNWQSYPVRIRDNAPLKRNELMQFLLSQQIATKPGIMNAHEEEPYKDFGYSLPNSERARQNTILLPLYHEITEETVKMIIDKIGQKCP